MLVIQFGETAIKVPYHRRILFQQVYKSLSQIQASFYFVVSINRCYNINYYVFINCLIVSDSCRAKALVLFNKNRTDIGEECRTKRRLTCKKYSRGEWKKNGRITRQGKRKITGRRMRIKDKGLKVGRGWSRDMAIEERDVNGLHKQTAFSIRKYGVPINLPCLE